MISNKNNYKQMIDYWNLQSLWKIFQNIFNINNIQKINILMTTIHQIVNKFKIV
jgi:hypothetical protein